MIDLTSDVLVERVTNINDQYFFGYYDMSPESPDGTKVLVNKPRFIDHMPMVDDELEIGYIDLTAKSFNKIAETHAWNFQEGCRLQWLSDITFLIIGTIMLMHRKRKKRMKKKMGFFYLI